MLTRSLKTAVADTPPTAKGRRIKLRYVLMGRRNPPTIVIHGTQTEKPPKDYQRYLINVFLKTFNLIGTPISLELKSSDNSYKN